MLAKRYDFEKFGLQKYLITYKTITISFERTEQKTNLNPKQANNDVNGQFQQTKSTKAVHVRLPHGICFNKGGSTLLSQYRPNS